MSYKNSHIIVIPNIWTTKNVSSNTLVRSNNKFEMVNHATTFQLKGDLSHSKWQITNLHVFLVMNTLINYGSIAIYKCLNLFLLTFLLLFMMNTIAVYLMQKKRNTTIQQYTRPFTIIIHLLSFSLLYNTL